MSNTYKDFSDSVKGAWREISAFFPLISAENNKIKDINKESAKNTVNLFCVVSENIPDSIRAIIAKNIEIKFAAVLTNIIENTFINDPEKISSWFKDTLANDEEEGQVVNNYVKDIRSSIVVESAKQGFDVVINEVSIEDMNKDVLNEASNLNSLNRSIADKQAKIATLQDNIAKLHRKANDISNEIHNMKGSKTASISAIKRAKALQQQITSQNNTLQKEIKEAAKLKDMLYKHIKVGEKEAKSVHKNIEGLATTLTKANATKRTGASAGHAKANQGMHDAMEFGYTFAADFKALDLQGTPHSIRITFFFHVKMMDVGTEQLYDAITTSKTRDNFFNYLKWRAGGTSFFKGFLLNLKEIDKDVARNTSDDLRSRIVSDMIKSSGFTAPKFWADLAEVRHYILVIDKADVDNLKTQFNFDIERTGNLYKLFNALKILTLVVVNQDRSEVTFYDSSNPARFNIINYKRITNEDDLLKRFTMSMRG